jgi:CRISPR-associated protein Cst1
MIRIYLRDWYYNTGMIGFLNVLSEGKMNISEIINQFKGKFVVQENYLEFDPTILEGFYEKYKKHHPNARMKMNPALEGQMYPPS